MAKTNNTEKTHTSQNARKTATLKQCTTVQEMYELIMEGKRQADSGQLIDGDKAMAEIKAKHGL